MAKRKKSQFGMRPAVRDIPNPFNPFERIDDPPAPSPKAPRPTRKVSISPAGQIRQRSVGVSSSSRQRTHKRGPNNRKKK